MTTNERYQPPIGDLSKLTAMQRFIVRIIIKNMDDQAEYDRIRNLDFEEQWPVILASPEEQAYLHSKIEKSKKINIGRIVQYMKEFNKKIFIENYTVYMAISFIGRHPELFKQ